MVVRSSSSVLDSELPLLLKEGDLIPRGGAGLEAGDLGRTGA